MNGTSIDNSELKGLKVLPDNRQKAKKGDTIIAIWFPENEWHTFKAEKLNKSDENDMGLGFSKNDTVYDIGHAFHAIVLK